MAQGSSLGQLKKAHNPPLDGVGVAAAAGAAPPLPPPPPPPPLRPPVALADIVMVG